MLPEIKTSIPGPRSLSLADRLRHAESRNVTYLSDHFPVFWERAEGVNVWDVDGNRYLDWTSGFGVSGLGYGAEPLRESLRQQSGVLMHAMGDVHPTELKVRLCEELNKIAFGRWGLQGKTVLGNSGFEAVEAALKTAFLATGRSGVLAFEGGYHGLGYGALDATGQDFFRSPFLKQLKSFTSFVPFPGCYRCPFGCTEGYRLMGDRAPNCSQSCLETLRERMTQEFKKRPIGAILVEPIQGRGGIQIPAPDFLPLLRDLADENEAVLIFDEIYTGFWRTGSLFACETSETIPDLICVGKALTGGFPLSACIGRADLMDAWPISQGEALHTSTFLGNPMGCAMALASLDEWNHPEWPTRLRMLEKILGTAFRTLALNNPLIGSVRGRGALWGVELIQSDGKPDAARCGKCIESGLAKGLILLGGGIHHNVLTFSPPFLISSEEIEWSCKIMGGLLSE